MTSEKKRQAVSFAGIIVILVVSAILAMVGHFWIAVGICCFGIAVNVVFAVFVLYWMPREERLRQERFDKIIAKLEEALAQYESKKNDK